MERVKGFVDFLEEYTDFIMRLASNRAELEMRQEDLEIVDKKIFRSNGSDADKIIGRDLKYEREKLSLQVKRLESNNERYEREKQSHISEGLSSLSGIAEILTEAGLDENQVEQLLAGVMFRISNKLDASAQNASNSSQHQPKKQIGGCGFHFGG